MGLTEAVQKAITLPDKQIVRVYSRDDTYIPRRTVWDRCFLIIWPKHISSLEKDAGIKYGEFIYSLCTRFGRRVDIVMRAPWVLFNNSLDALIATGAPMVTRNFPHDSGHVLNTKWWNQYTEVIRSIYQDGKTIFVITSSLKDYNDHIWMDMTRNIVEEIYDTTP